eukprot:CAMPEP_0183748356 /NCGR_PEP_ID=MMETSP0737-20130205/67728_1 /TAXON_ID=385413 /ORGANISM="Thalassiosira miniscula, Strain CCMP1093" /LENGTH=164 /DNA_ID=CAMNT_0025984077 /DNA_START=1117 /DNA_END=1611 /DNA_ORIENTATION=+
MKMFSLRFTKRSFAKHSGLQNTVQDDGTGKNLGDNSGDKLQNLSGNDYYEKHMVDSPLDVHTCNSLLCTACRSESTVKFVKTTETSAESRKNCTQKPSSNHTKRTNLQPKLIIENISSIGIIRAYSSNHQTLGQGDIELLNGTESISDDESVLRFIESIENGTK